MELSKSNRRIAREIIRKGMMVEFQQGLEKSDKILNDWKEQESNPQEVYHALYKHIITFNKQIAQRYDGIGNNVLEWIVIQQLNEGLIDEKELEAFSEEGQAMMNRLISFRRL